MATGPATTLSSWFLEPKGYEDLEHKDDDGTGSDMSPYGEPRMTGFPDESEQKTYWEGAEGRRSPDHPVVAAFADPKVDFVRRSLDGPEAVGQVLDVGCGNGFFTRPFAAWQPCVALDFSLQMLRLNAVDVAKICGSALELPFRDNAFGLVFCSNLLHHVSNPADALVEMKRTSSRYVVVSEPNRTNPFMFAFGALKAAERGTLRFSRRYMLRIAARAGLEVVQVRTMGGVLPNKTPKSLLWLFKLLDGGWPLAFYHVMVCRHG